MNLYKTFSDEELFFSEIIPKLLHDLTLSHKLNSIIPLLYSLSHEALENNCQNHNSTTTQPQDNPKTT